MRASGQTNAGPTSQLRNLVLRGRRFADACRRARTEVIRRQHPVRRGSEQRTGERASLEGSRGGGGNWDSPWRNAGQSRFPLSLRYLRHPVGVSLRRLRKIKEKTPCFSAGMNSTTTTLPTSF